MDLADRAQELEQRDRDAALARMRAGQKAGAGRIDCAECGTEIEPKRREVLEGTEVCAFCAGERERWGKRR